MAWRTAWRMALRRVPPIGRMVVCPAAARGRAHARLPAAAGRQAVTIGDAVRPAGLRVKALRWNWWTASPAFARQEAWPAARQRAAEHPEMSAPDAAASPTAFPRHDAAPVLRAGLPDDAEPWAKSVPQAVPPEQGRRAWPGVRQARRASPAVPPGEEAWPGEGERHGAQRAAAREEVPGALRSARSAGPADVRPVDAPPAAQRASVPRAALDEDAPCRGDRAHLRSARPARSARAVLLQRMESR